MVKILRSLLILAAVALLTNCINVEMETTVNTDRSGSGKLVYAWDPAKNVEQVDIDGTFSTIRENPTVHVTGTREYDSEGTHYREITWTFEDINTVDMEGLTYSFKNEEGRPVLRAIFEKIETKTAEAETSPSPDGTRAEERKEAPLQGEASAQAAGTASVEGKSGPAGSTGPMQAPAASSGAQTGTTLKGQGLSAQEQQEIDAETQAQMEEMLDVMIKAALEGYSVKFRFILPRDVQEAPGAKIDGRTATWEIPLNDLVNPGREGALDEFEMVMKPE